MELAYLAQVRARAIRHAVSLFLRGSKLRLAVAVCLVICFWLLMFAMFLDAFTFLRRNFLSISDLMLDYLFAFLFAALLAMMTISNTIIAYTSLFRSKETEFLLTLPAHAENAFVYRATDSVVFGLWGLATLVAPLVLACGVVFPATWYFLPFAALFSLLLLALATELGAVLALLVAVVLQRHKKLVVAMLGLAAACGIFFWLLPVWRQRNLGLFNEATVKTVMDRIAFCQHWALPSQWVGHGILAAGRGESGQAVFLTLLLLSNVLFLGLVAQRLAFHVYRATWETVQGASTARRYRSAAFGDSRWDRVLSPVPFRLRQLVRKDLKTFLRDPAEWSQFVLFFGLLGLYVTNLPRFNVKALEPYYHSLISLLNLAATCLTLATLTSRFVFPQLSLEGRRIWITGLLPMRRSLILWAKFLFATAGTFAISATLIALSDAFLGLPLWMLGAHIVVVLCVCCGLNGLALGLGALCPHMGTDNPSKIVSSFGGTLNLICSICFIVLAITPVVVPMHLYMLGLWGPHQVAVWLPIALGIVAIVSAAVCLVPMVAGARAFARMEF